MADCGLTNLATCLPEKFFEYLSGMLTAPVQPLLTLIQELLTEPVNVSLFYSFWSAIMYIISLFYGFFFLLAGFNLMVSGYDLAKREKAKSWLRNTVLMILFVQSSYLIYELIIELGSLLTAGIVNFIEPEFFLMKTDNFANFSLQLVLLVPQLIVLVGTVLLLGLRYLIVAVGVVLFPLGLFFYFLPSIQNYGKLIINILITAVFMPFFASLFLLGSSLLLNTPVFSQFKVVLVTVTFLCLDLIIAVLIIFALVKSVGVGSE